MLLAQLGTVMTQGHCGEQQGTVTVQQDTMVAKKCNDNTLHGVKKIGHCGGTAEYNKAQIWQLGNCVVTLEDLKVYISTEITKH